MHKHVQMLDEEALVEHKKHIGEEIVKLKLFADLARAPEGKFVLDWIESRKKNLHSFYAAIPAHDPRACITLSAVQAAESELDALKERILDAENYKKVLEQQLAHVIRLLESRRKSAENSPTKLVSKAIRREDAQN